MSANIPRTATPMAPRRTVRIAVLLALCLLCIATRAPAAGKVTLLQPPPNGTAEWPEATRATIAELVLAGFEVNVERTRQVTLAGALGELQRETLDPRVVAALFITRSRDEGLGYIWIAGSSAPIEVSEKDPDLAVSQSSLALRLADLLRKRHLHLPASAAPSEPAEAVEPEPDDAASRFTLGPRLGLGAVRSNGATAGVAGLGMFLTWRGKLTGALDVRHTWSPLDVETVPGVASIGYTELSTSLCWNFLHHERGLRAAVGLSYGILWLTSDAIATPEYAGRADSTTTSALAAVVQLGYKAGELGLDLVLQPGLLLPELRVTLEDTAVQNVGRPWLSGFLVVTWGV